MATNQGESSTQDNVVKKPAMMPTPENIEGNESGVSTTAGLGTTSGQQSTGIQYNVHDENTQNYSGPEFLNGTYDHADLSAKWQNGQQQVPEAGQNQYQ